MIPFQLWPFRCSFAVVSISSATWMRCDCLSRSRSGGERAGGKGIELGAEKKICRRAFIPFDFRYLCMARSVINFPPKKKFLSLSLCLSPSLNRRRKNYWYWWLPQLLAVFLSRQWMRRAASAAVSTHFHFSQVKNPHWEDVICQMNFELHGTNENEQIGALNKFVIHFSEKYENNGN